MAKCWVQLRNTNNVKEWLFYTLPAVGQYIRCEGIRYWVESIELWGMKDFDGYAAWIVVLESPKSESEGIYD